MKNKLVVLFLVMIFALSFPCIAIEKEFTYDNFYYKITTTIDEIDGSSSFNLTATFPVNQTGSTSPASSIAADVILDALGYNSETADYTNDENSFFSALTILDKTPVTVSNFSSFEQQHETPSTFDPDNGLMEPPVDFLNNSPASQSEQASSSSANSVKVVIYDISFDERRSITFPDQKPVIVNDRTLIPVRGLFEDLGFIVTWDESTQTANIAKPGINVRVPVGQNVIYRGDRAIPLDVPAQLINSRTMIPLRAISEAVGLEVEWNEETKTVTINISNF